MIRLTFLLRTLNLAYGKKAKVLHIQTLHEGCLLFMHESYLVLEKDFREGRLDFLEDEHREM